MIFGPIKKEDFEDLKEMLNKQAFTPNRILMTQELWQSIVNPVNALYTALLKYKALVRKTTKDGDTVLVEIEYRNSDHPETITLRPKDE